MYILLADDMKELTFAQQTVEQTEVTQEIVSPELSKLNH